MGGTKVNSTMTQPSAPRGLTGGPDLSFMQNMPAEYYGNSPINDPSSILRAYTQNMPRFIQNNQPQQQPQTQTRTQPKTIEDIRQDFATIVASRKK